MARKITQEATAAFLSKRNFSSSNTSVSNNGEVTILRLHNNAIAFLDNQCGVLQITNCGWFSNTTKERLNALPNVNIYQKKGVWYLNGEQWNGNLTTININAHQ